MSLPPFSSSNCLTFKPVSVVTPPAKISVWDVEVYWSLCLLSSTFPKRRPRCSPPIFLCASCEIRSQTDGCTLGIGSITVTRETVPPSPPPCDAALERQRSGQRSPQPQNRMKERTEQLLPMSLSVAFSYKTLNIAPDTQGEQGLLDHWFPSKTSK